MISTARARWLAMAEAVGAISGLAAWLDLGYGWVTPAFDFVAHQF